MDNVNLKIVIAIARSYNKLFGIIEDGLKKFDLTTSEFGVLELLLHKGDTSIQQIAEKILVTSGTITYILDKLVKKGLVVRKRCLEDKRIYYVALTESGEKLIKEAFCAHQNFMDSLMRELDETQKENLVELLIQFQSGIANE